MAFITATKRFVKRAARFSVDTGASLVEYTLLVALIAAVAIGAVTFLGSKSKDTMCNAATAIGNAGVTSTTVAPSGSGC